LDLGRRKGQEAGENCTRNDNIKMVIRDIGMEDVNWIHLSQGGERWWTLVSAVKNHQLHKCGEYLDALSIIFASRKDCATRRKLIT
jgi:hypothetical protein